jgi:hypothetical protein
MTITSFGASSCYIQHERLLGFFQCEFAASDRRLKAHNLSPGWHRTTYRLRSLLWVGRCILDLG